ncbi:protein MRVI1 isoform X2 [Xenopus tropicalis]|uniref:Protein MRVI1 isoform X2 n=1 Tax=Xenopus tropicalis TaxID=8364 RepID=A0A8J1JHX7_XENTR|nr:protein MRVI1 isoform X2 [Xenopus tropicalis]
MPGDKKNPADAQQPPYPGMVTGTATADRACITPAIIVPQSANAFDETQEKNCLDRHSPHSPSGRLSRQSRSSTSSSNNLISVDNKGHVIDLVHDNLPDVRISDEDKKKNLELLEEAKKVSERFLTRRGRKSQCSISDSPTGPLDAYPPVFVGPAAIVQSATKGLANGKQNDQRKVSQGRLSPRSSTAKDALSEQKENFDPLKHVSRKTSGSDGCKPSLSNNENGPGKSILKKPKEMDSVGNAVQGPGATNPGINSKGLSAEQPDPKCLSRSEPGDSAGRPPLLRALSWDSLAPAQTDRTHTGNEKDFIERLHDQCNNKLPKLVGLKDFHVQPVRLQKLTKLREEHKLMRSQNLTGQKLPDLSEAAEQERGPSPVPSLSEDGEEAKGESDVMPSIPDILLRKLRVNRCLSNSAPPLTEKEVENVFIQLSLAFRNDSYTLESRLNQAERERNLTEENNEKEIENFKATITSSVSIWQNSEHREAYQKLLEDISVLHRLTNRLSSRAEMVGAVRQEKRMSKATEVMMQYVENLKRTYEKDHAELMEYKKLANQNSSRNYSGSDDGVARSSRSMSLTIGKNMPRRRVSVAVVPKFNLLNIPGQSPNTSPLPLMPPLTESPIGRSSSPVLPTQSPLVENAKPSTETEGEAPVGVPVRNEPEEISPEMKAKIEEEAYNKGYQEGLKKIQGMSLFKEEEEEKASEVIAECEDEVKEEITKLKSSKIEECLDYVQMLYPKLLTHWNVLSIVAAGIVLLAVLLSIYNSFTSCSELPAGHHGKASCSASQRYSWWTSGLPHKQRRQ